MKIAFIAASGILAATAAGCGSSFSPASRIAPGSAVVPCSRISAQIQAIQPYYTFPGPNDSSPLYGLETALANKFGNVSNLDSPLNLSGAEVNFEVDVLNDSSVTQNQPFSTAVENDVAALASACGID
jgi:hypothetical protein